MNNISIAAVILAGGKTEESLALFTDAKSKGFIEIAGKTIVDYEIDAIKKTGLISQIALVADEENVPRDFKGRVDIIAKPGDKIINSLKSGIESIHPAPDYAFIIPADMPLVTAEAISDFLHKSIEAGADVAYAYLSKEGSISKYPDAHHTYARLREGTYCGTGFFLMKPAVVPKCEELFNKFTDNRKNPLGLAKLIGIWTVIQFVFGMASIKTLEERISELMGCKGAAIQTKYADAGFNIDDVNELEIAKRILEIPADEKYQYTMNS